MPLCKLRLDLHVLLIKQKVNKLEMHSKLTGTKIHSTEARGKQLNYRFVQWWVTAQWERQWNIKLKVQSPPFFFSFQPQ